MRKSLQDWLGSSTAAKSPCSETIPNETEDISATVTPCSNALGDLIQRRMDKLTREFWKLDAEAMQQPCAIAEWSAFEIDGCQLIHGSHGLLHCSAGNGTVDLWIQVHSLAYPKALDRRHQLSLDAVHSSFAKVAGSLAGRAVIDHLMDLLNTKGCVLYAPSSHIIRWSASLYVIRRFVLCT